MELGTAGSLLKLFLVVFFLCQVVQVNSQINKRVQISNKEISSFRYASIGSAVACYSNYRVSGEVAFVDSTANNRFKSQERRQIYVDDYLQYLPLAGIFAFDLVGVKAKHNLKDRIIISAIAYGLMGGTVNVMKKTIKANRPDRSNNRSFPSGHTAQAFTGAQILFREYYQSSVGVAMMGYMAASATGALRIVNEKHYAKDVLTGAAIGVLSVEVSYLLYPYVSRLFGGRSKQNVMITPVLSSQELGVYMSYTF